MVSFGCGSFEIYYLASKIGAAAGVQVVEVFLPLHRQKEKLDLCKCIVLWLGLEKEGLCLDLCFVQMVEGGAWEVVSVLPAQELHGLSLPWWRTNITVLGVLRKGTLHGWQRSVFNYFVRALHLLFFLCRSFWYGFPERNYPCYKLNFLPLAWMKSLSNTYHMALRKSREDFFSFYNATGLYPSANLKKGTGLGENLHVYLLSHRIKLFFPDIFKVVNWKHSLFLKKWVRDIFFCCF